MASCSLDGVEPNGKEENNGKEEKPLTVKEWYSDNRLVEAVRTTEYAANRWRDAYTEKYIYKYYYNPDGKRSLDECYDETGNVINKKEYSYTKDGLLLQTVSSSINSNSIQTYTYTYSGNKMTEEYESRSADKVLHHSRMTWIYSDDTRTFVTKVERETYPLSPGALGFVDISTYGDTYYYGMRYNYSIDESGNIVNKTKEFKSDEATLSYPSPKESAEDYSSYDYSDDGTTLLSTYRSLNNSTYLDDERYLLSNSKTVSWREVNGIQEGDKRTSEYQVTYNSDGLTLSTIGIWNGVKSYEYTYTYNGNKLTEVYTNYDSQGDISSKTTSECTYMPIPTE